MDKHARYSLRLFAVGTGEYRILIEFFFFSLSFKSRASFDVSASGGDGLCCGFSATINNEKNG